jgi:dihydroorotate dehydrogenase
MLFLKLLLPVIALLGIFDASYITYEKFSGRIVQCLPGFACAKVLESPWAYIGPVPLSLMGLLFYTTVLILSSLLVLQLRYIHLDGKRFSVFQILRVLTTFGFFFSLYLIFIMGVVIGGWCLWCLFSALTSTLLFVVTSVIAVGRKREVEFPLRLAAMSLLYQRLLRPFVWLFDAEFVHNRFVFFGQLLSKFPFGKSLTGLFFSYKSDTLGKTIAGIYFPNPVGLSAGFDYDGKLTDVLPAVGFGFATLGTVTSEPYDGNPRPMLARFPDSRALLVNKGFKSEGAIAVIKRLENRPFAIPIGISIGSTNREYTSLSEQIANVIDCFKRFEASGVRHSYYELNISCPNTRGGQPFTDVARINALLTAFDKIQVKKPVFIKMPIDLSEKETLALLTRISKSKSVTGVIFGNLTKDHSNPDVKSQDREKWKTMAGNLSGKPTWNRSNRYIELTKKTFGNRFVIIGTGGIFSGDDAKEKIRLGADLVQLITGMIFMGPQLIGEINWTLDS